VRGSDRMENIHKEQLHNLYSDWQYMKHVWERGGMHIGLWCERQKERGHWNALNVGGRIILRLILDK
jgi:hypothetical protein